MTQSQRKITYIIAAVAILLVVAGGSFVGGFAIGKNGSTTTATSGAAGNMKGLGGGRGGFSRNGGIGTVTAISNTSITITPISFGNNTSTTNKTYTIDSSTTFTKDGATATESDIASGDTVRIQTSSATSTTATAIEISPTMGGAPTTQAE